MKIYHGYNQYGQGDMSILEKFIECMSKDGIGLNGHCDEGNYTLQRSVQLCWIRDTTTYDEAIKFHARSG